MENKTKIDEKRIEDICKDLKKIKTLEELKKFLQNEIKLTDEMLALE